MEESINKHKKEKNVMSSYIIAGILIVIVLITFLPAQTVLTLGIEIPSTTQSNPINIIDNSIVIVNNRVTLIQYIVFYITPKQTTEGNIEVNMKLKDYNNEVRWNESYFLSEGKWTINTYQPISSSDIVVIELPYYNYKREITID